MPFGITSRCKRAVILRWHNDKKHRKASWFLSFLIITHKKSLAGNACLFKVVESITVEWKQYALLLQTRRFSPPRWRHWWTIHVTIVDRILLQCQILRVGRYCHVVGAFLHVVTWPIGQLLLAGWPGSTLLFLGIDTRWILVVFMMISVYGNNFKMNSEWPRKSFSE